jgi:hypothetical protein
MNSDNIGINIKNTISNNIVGILRQGNQVIQRDLLEYLKANLSDAKFLIDVEKDIY